LVKWQKLLLSKCGQATLTFTPPNPSSKKRGNLGISLSIYELLPFDKGEDGWGWITPPNPLFREEGR